MSTWRFWVGPVSDATQPANGPREKLSMATFGTETYFVDKGQRKLQRQLKQLEAHTCTNKPLKIMLLFFQRTVRFSEKQ